jgi:hypothetical protein
MRVLDPETKAVIATADDPSADRDHIAATAFVFPPPEGIELGCWLNRPVPAMVEPRYAFAVDWWLVDETRTPLGPLTFGCSNYAERFWLVPPEALEVAAQHLPGWRRVTPLPTIELNHALR